MQLSADSLNNAWSDFSVFRKPLAREHLIQHYAYLVKVTIGRLIATPPTGVEREDLVGVGMIGLVKAVDGYDITRDVKFETYAIAKIRGAVLEMLRQEDWVPRSIREKLRALDRTVMALECELGREPSEQEIADRMAISIQSVCELIARSTRTSVQSLSDVIGTAENGITLLDLIVDEAEDPSREIESQEIRRIVARGIDRLPSRERMVVALYYDNGLTFREIGKVLDVSEPRAFYIHGQAMTRLRHSMVSEGLMLDNKLLAA